MPVERIQKLSFQLETRALVEPEISKNAEILAVVIRSSRVSIVARIISKVVGTAAGLLYGRTAAVGDWLRVGICEPATSFAKIAADRREEVLSEWIETTICYPPDSAATPTGD